jgi:hypothetical protein
VSAVVSLVIVLATLAFGSVYPWAKSHSSRPTPGLSVIGFVPEADLPGEYRSLAICLLLVALAIGGQLVPAPARR